jgi:hypothetical protein
MTASTLDSIAGLGEIRRKTLMTRFGSLKRLAAASVEEIESVPGIGRRTAEAIVAALHGDAPATPTGDRPDPGVMAVIPDRAAAATGRSDGESDPDAEAADADETSRST